MYPVLSLIYSECHPNIQTYWPPLRSSISSNMSHLFVKRKPFTVLSRTLSQRKKNIFFSLQQHNEFSPLRYESKESLFFWIIFYNIIVTARAGIAQLVLWLRYRPHNLGFEFQQRHTIFLLSKTSRMTVGPTPPVQWVQGVNWTGAWS
jgi:hypothetical protein